MADENYLAAAKEEVDKAVAAYDANVRPETEIDELLSAASKTACEALRRFHNDSDTWERLGQRDKRSVFVALTEIIKKREGPSSHFDFACLPITANALRAFGFKPPEEAEQIVERARQACEALSSEAHPRVMASFARQAIKELADVTCGLSDQLRTKIESQEARTRWRIRAVNLLRFVSETIAAAMIAHVIDSTDLDKLSDAGKSAVCVVAMQGIDECARKGVEQARKDTKEQLPNDDGKSARENDKDRR